MIDIRTTKRFGLMGDEADGRKNPVSGGYSNSEPTQELFELQLAIDAGSYNGPAVPWNPEWLKRNMRRAHN